MTATRIPRRIKTILFSAAVFLVLTFALGNVHHELFEVLPQDGIPGMFAESFLLLIAILPALIAGFIAGYMSRIRGVLVGAVAVSIATVSLFGILGADNLSQQLVTTILGGLAGGCGEWLAPENAG